MRIPKSKLQKLKPMMMMDSENFKTFVKVIDKIKNSFNLSEVPLPDMDLFEVPGHYLIGSMNALNRLYI